MVALFENPSHLVAADAGYVSESKAYLTSSTSQGFRCSMLPFHDLDGRRRVDRWKKSGSIKERSPYLVCLEALLHKI